MNATTDLTLRCNDCRCLISQAEADAAREIFDSGNTLCQGCAKSLRDANDE